MSILSKFQCYLNQTTFQHTNGLTKTEFQDLLDQQTLIDITTKVGDASSNHYWPVTINETNVKNAVWQYLLDTDRPLDQITPGLSTSLPLHQQEDLIINDFLDQQNTLVILDKEQRVLISTELI